MPCGINCRDIDIPELLRGDFAEKYATVKHVSNFPSISLERELEYMNFSAWIGSIQVRLLRLLMRRDLGSCLLRTL